MSCAPLGRTNARGPFQECVLDFSARVQSRLLSTIATPVSRKKKGTSTGGGEGAGGEGAKSSPTPAVNFTQLAHKAIAMVDTAISPLVSMNPGYSLHRHGTPTDRLVLDCGAKVGKYTFRVDYDEERISYQSPISGQLEYMADLSAATSNSGGEVGVLWL
jgi:hypothetical protein